MAAQQQVRIPFGKKQELDALRAKVQQDMARPVGDPERITDMQAAQKLQEAATGKSDPLTDLKNMRLDGGGEDGGVPQNLAGQPGVPAAPQFASPPPNPNLTETEQRENNANIMTPGYGNQGVGGGILESSVGPEPTPMPEYPPEGVPPTPMQGAPNNMRPGMNVPWHTPRTPPDAPPDAPPQFVDAYPRVTAQEDMRMEAAMRGREKAGPMDAVRQTGGGLLDGLRGMGKSAGGYMKSLFNDPQRMAMLQGGLSMMDPNSYYDKQGFGSVFTGMNKGLGAAQAGHKGVLDRRALVQKTATAKAAAAKAASGGNPTEVDIGNGRVQLFKDGAAFGKPFMKDYAPGKVTYKTITENTENGGTRKVNYRIDGQGNKKQESVADVTKIVAGIGKDNKLTVQQWNNTTQTATDIVVKKTDFTPAQVMGAVNILSDLNKWDDLLKANPKSAGELVGKPLSLANWLSESFNQGTPFKERAEIETMINQLKPMLTPEVLKDSRISEAEWKIAKAALGLGEWSTGMDKRRAIPALKKIIKIRSGLPLDGEVGSTGGSGQTATGYTPGSQSKHF